MPIDNAFKLLEKNFKDYTKLIENYYEEIKAKRKKQIYTQNFNKASTNPNLFESFEGDKNIYELDYSTEYLEHEHDKRIHLE